MALTFPIVMVNAGKEREVKLSDIGGVMSLSYETLVAQRNELMNRHIEAKMYYTVKCFRIEGRLFYSCTVNGCSSSRSDDVFNEDITFASIDALERFIINMYNPYMNFLATIEDNKECLTEYEELLSLLAINIPSIKTAHNTLIKLDLFK